jgi:hypothetical protein
MHFDIAYDDTIKSGGSVEDAINELIETYNMIVSKPGNIVRVVDVPLGAMSDKQQTALAALIPRSLWRERNHTFGTVSRPPLFNTHTYLDSDGHPVMSVFRPRK